MQRKSIYDFPRKYLAQAIYGSDNPGSMRRLYWMLSGEKKMTVDQLYLLTRVEPLLDLELTLRDLYERYEIAKMKKKKKRREKPQEFGFYDQFGPRKGEGES